MAEWSPTADAGQAADELTPRAAGEAAQFSSPVVDSLAPELGGADHLARNSYVERILARWAQQRHHDVILPTKLTSGALGDLCQFSTDVLLMPRECRQRRLASRPLNSRQFGVLGF